MQGTTILVVEDERSISEVVTLYLTRSGYQVITAHDGRAALQELTKGRPDLIILDLMLPEIDGWEITRRVRAEGAT
ncbi:MAG: response regulator, partial [Caldilineaceae bacterium]|nr:response regulator [Caldilineaceae bacterium]